MTPWSQLEEALTSCGYTVSIGDPGHGAVIGFDGIGRTLLLATGVTSAEGFVTPVVERLD
jgi:hypothetical protein